MMQRGFPGVQKRRQQTAKQQMQPVIHTLQHNTTGHCNPVDTTWEGRKEGMATGRDIEQEERGSQGVVCCCCGVGDKGSAAGATGSEKFLEVRTCFDQVAGE